MWILGTLYCCSFPLSLANWGQRTGLFLIYLTWCSKTGSIIAPPLTKPLSSSSCFLLLTSCHHQSFTFYLFSHLISQNHHWLYFLSIFLPYFFFYHPATLNLNVYGSFHSCALFFFSFASLYPSLTRSLLRLRGVGVCGVCVCVCSRAPVCVSPVGRVFWGSSFTSTVPMSLADSWFPIYWHPLLKWDIGAGPLCLILFTARTICLTAVAVLCLYWCCGPPGLPLSRQPFLAEPECGSQAVSPLRALPCLVTSSLWKVLCGIDAVVMPRCWRETNLRVLSAESHHQAAWRYCCLRRLSSPRIPNKPFFL